SSLAAAFVHLAQTLAGIEHAAGWLASWAAAQPSAIAFALLAAAAFWLPDAARGSGEGAGASAARGGSGVRPADNLGHAAKSPVERRVGTVERRVPGAIPFALGWLGCFAIPVWPIAYSWNSYYYTLAAVGGAVLVTQAAARITRW